MDLTCAEVVTTPASPSRLMGSGQLMSFLGAQELEAVAGIVQGDLSSLEDSMNLTQQKEDLNTLSTYSISHLPDSNYKHPNNN